MGSRLLGLLVSLALVFGASCRADALFIDAAELPAGAEWAAVLVEDLNGRLIESFGLRAASDGPIILESELSRDADRVVLLLYRQVDLEGLVRDFSPALMASPLRAPSLTEPVLPTPTWQSAIALAGGELESEAGRRLLTSEALLGCEALGTARSRGVFQISCADAPCIPDVRQLDCQLELDFRNGCRADFLRGRLDARGGFDVESEDGWYGRCAAEAPRPGASFELECHRANDSVCRVEGARSTDRAPVEWDSSKLLPEAPDRAETPEALLADGLWPLGDDRLVTFTPGRHLCVTESPRRLLYVSRQTLEVTQTATMADCIVAMAPQPETAGFWALSVTPLAISRLDAEGRVHLRKEITLDAISSTGLPFSFEYERTSNKLIASFAEDGRESRTLVEYVSFDPDTLNVRGRRVFNLKPRMELFAFAWGTLVALDDDMDQLRLLDPETFETLRTVPLASVEDRRNYASIAYSEALDRLLVRVSGSFRAVLFVDRELEITRVLNFETTLHAFAHSALGGEGATEVVVGFGESMAPAHGFIGLIDLEHERFWPGLSSIETDYPDVFYSDTREASAYALLRTTARILKFRRTNP